MRDGIILIQKKRNLNLTEVEKLAKDPIVSGLFDSRPMFLPLPCDLPL